MKKGKDARPHIGILGKRNMGKSSLINFMTGQDVAIVSPEAGTTTDPVKKAAELMHVGPVTFVDTAGSDDTGELGRQRVGRTRRMVQAIDLGIIVFSGSDFGKEEEDLVSLLEKWEVPFILVHNKADLQVIDSGLRKALEHTYGRLMDLSTRNAADRDELLDLVRERLPESAYLSKSLVGDVISQGDLVLLITPIDDEAPEGRLILPQVQAIRDILDNEAIAVVAKEREIDQLIRELRPRPALAICDSQVFKKADASIPDDIPLTSFSTVLARYKGDFSAYLKGTPELDKLKDGDKVLVLESCTHQVSCDDIGRVKLPRWLRSFSGKQLDFEVVTGLDSVPGQIEDYSIVIQCGGCMITRKQLTNRLKPAIEAGIPVTNYGMAIAYMHGIFERAVAPFVKTEETYYL